jgi:acylphosphatase
MLTARRFRIRGRVQGVGYRYFAQEVADREGISGWARNRPDGSVEVMAEGDQEALDRFEAALRRGPRLARVDEVIVESQPPSGRQTGFNIRG